MTEIFLQDDCFLKGKDEEGQKTIDERIAEVHETMTKAIRQAGAKVKVTRWFPGVLQTISEEVKSKSSSTSVVISRRGSVRDLLASEATKNLESKRNNQLDATKEKTLDDIKKEMGIPVDTPAPAAKEPVLDSILEPSIGSKPPPKTTLRRVRQKMRSTPVVGGSLFDDIKPSAPVEEPTMQAGDGGKSIPHSFTGSLGGQSAELVVNGEVFKIRVMPETVHRIRSGYSGELLEDSSVNFSQKDVPIEHRLQGFIRTSDLQTISEDLSDDGSEKDSEQW